jgi:hypothetical protein
MMLEHFHRDYLCHTEAVADGVFHVAKGLNNLSIRQRCNGNDRFLWKDMSVPMLRQTRGRTLMADGSR